MEPNMHQVRYVGHGVTYTTANDYKRKIRTIAKNPRIKENAYIIHTETEHIQYGTGTALAALHVTRIGPPPPLPQVILKEY